VRIIRSSGWCWPIQFKKRGIFSARVGDISLAIIDSGKDAAMM